MTAASATMVEFGPATLHGIPLYDGDIEQRDSLPPAVVELKARIVASDGVILATLKYGNDISGVFKSRPLAWRPAGARDESLSFGAAPK